MTASTTRQRRPRVQGSPGARTRSQPVTSPCSRWDHGGLRAPSPPTGACDPPSDRIAVSTRCPRLDHSSPRSRCWPSASRGSSGRERHESTIHKAHSRPSLLRRPRPMTGSGLLSPRSLAPHGLTERWCGPIATSRCRARRSSRSRLSVRGRPFEAAQTRSDVSPSHSPREDSSSRRPASGRSPRSTPSSPSHRNPTFDSRRAPSRVWSRAASSTATARPFPGPRCASTTLGSS